MDLIGRICCVWANGYGISFRIVSLFCWKRFVT